MTAAQQEPTYPIYLFAYGSLMSAQVFRRVVGRSPEEADPRCSKALLKGYLRRAVKEKWYPGIIPNPSHSVQGLIMQLNTHEDLIRLDRFEGSEYKRVLVTVSILDGTPGWEPECQAYVYEWLGGKEALDDEDWSLEKFERTNIPDSELRNPE
ncbi:Butirosin biosynthesis, BtrG-like protein [Chytridium lagenaria]|nr:Butirosin biosynthesis, BtrG-like protein [Chytridium lagenaria]